MTDRVEFIFDVGSPNAYLAWRALPDYIDPGAVDVEIVPCLLGGIFKAAGNRSPIESFATVKGKLDYEMLEMRRFVKRHDLSRFRMNEHFPINTLVLMRAMIAAGDRQSDYLEAVMAGLWEDNRDMADPAVVADVLAAAGFEAKALMEKAQSAPVKQQLIDNTQKAVDRGAFGVPTFFVGDEMYFGKDRLEQLARAVKARGD